ncbi:MAG TPA: hypothetical protein VF898_07320, partial [Chloroflexota bacterium]
MTKRSTALRSALTFAILVVIAASVMGQQPTQGVMKALGTIKSISGNTINLATDSGSEITVQLRDATRILRVAPGQDLKEATSITVQDLQAGDRILVRGKAGDSDKQLTATTIVAMKKGDIAQKQQKDLQDWQRRGIGGLVKSMDPSSGSIGVSAMTATGAKTVTVKTNSKTIIRRYSPDSVKFDDARPATL